MKEITRYTLCRSAKYQARAALALEFQHQKSVVRAINRTPEYWDRQYDFYQRMKALNTRGVA